MATPRSEMQVLSLGLLRTGTASMAEAYRILGYKNVFHGLCVLEDDHYWHNIERASDMTFPGLPSYIEGNMDWDELFGSYDVVTDTASLFAKQLIPYYPNAKVVLTVRDIDNWCRSIDMSILSSLATPFATFTRVIAERFTKAKHMRAGWKLITGYFGANDMDGCRQNLRTSFKEHEVMVRAMVPPERLLVFKVGDGWEPLCEFLGKPIPDVDFPWHNEGEMLRGIIRNKVNKIAWQGLCTIAAAIAGIAAIITGWKML